MKPKIVLLILWVRFLQSTSSTDHIPLDCFFDGSPVIIVDPDIVLVQKSQILGF